MENKSGKQQKVQGHSCEQDTDALQSVHPMCDLCSSHCEHKMRNHESQV